MGRDDISGRFQPGESANPGGRPGTALARTLGGRRARKALLNILEAIGPGLTVVVLDARGLVIADDGARRAGVDADMDAPAPLDAERIAARVEAREDAAAELVALEQLAAEGWRETVRVTDLDGGGRQSVSRFLGPAGEDLGWMSWRDVVRWRVRAVREVGSAKALVGAAFWDATA